MRHRLETRRRLVSRRGHQPARVVDAGLQGHVLPELPGDSEQNGEHPKALHRRDRRSLCERRPRDCHGDGPPRRRRRGVARRFAGGHVGRTPRGRRDAAAAAARREEPRNRTDGDRPHDHSEGGPRVGPVQPRLPSGEVLGGDDGLCERLGVSAARRSRSRLHQAVGHGRPRDADVRGLRPRARIAESPLRDGRCEGGLPRVPREAKAGLPREVTFGIAAGDVGPEGRVERIGSGEPHIRVAGGADLDGLAEWWEKLENYHAYLGGPEYRLAPGWKGDWRRFTRGHIGHRDRLCLVAELDRAAVGFRLGAILARPRVFEHRSYGHIYDLFVDPARRNRGVGESLVKEALGWFRSRRVEKVDLYTHARNEIGLRFWKKMGFKTNVHILERRI